MEKVHCAGGPFSEARDRFIRSGRSGFACSRSTIMSWQAIPESGHFGARPNPRTRAPPLISGKSHIPAAGPADGPFREPVRGTLYRLYPVQSPFH